MTMNRISSLFAVAILMLIVAGSATVYAQTYTDLYNLGTNAGDPVNPAWMGLFAQGRDGNLYSTSQGGGAFIGGNQYGTVFRLTPSGTMTVLHSFDIAKDGAHPNSGLTLGADGSLYGTTPGGGPVGFGTVFKITTAGTFTVVHNFNGNTEGVSANAPPILGMDGLFYGTTGNGGGAVFGTVYKMTTKGKLTVLHTFDGITRYPQAITLGLDGNFYGTFLGGTGVNVNGGVFRITPKKKFVVLHSFTGTDGQNPMGAIIQAVDGNFYGTTRAGGTGSQGVVYKMTPSGNITVLHNFANDGHGLAPFAGLAQATDGKFYGTTINNPGTSFGVLFQISSTGSYADVVFFSNVAGAFKGASAQVSIFQHTNGTLYGDTNGGGLNTGCVGCGVLYSLNMGLGPFARLVYWTGTVGSTVQILGQGLTGTTGVKFNGTPATFNVVSDTYLTTTLPAGATAGNVTVTTPGGTLTSNHIFLVVPVITGFSPPSGPVGSLVMISGSGLTGVTLVKFGSKSAAFTVNNDGQITATVPAGAKTGKISVTSPGGVATSKLKFTVTP